MIVQENDFLKTYNDMNKLWEAADAQSYDFSFATIISKALSNELDQLDYWKELKQIVRQKFNRGGKRIKWYTKLVNAYMKTFCMENLVYNLIFGKDTTYQFCFNSEETFGAAGLQNTVLTCKLIDWDFNDSKRDSMYVDVAIVDEAALEAQADRSNATRGSNADYVVEAKFYLGDQDLGNYRFMIDCKSLGYEAQYTHGAPLIAVYNNADGCCYLEATSDFGSLLSSLSLPEDHPLIRQGKRQTGAWRRAINIFIDGKATLAFDPLLWEDLLLAELFNKEDLGDITFRKLRTQLDAIDKQLSKDESDLDKPIVDYLVTQSNKLVRQINKIDPAAGVPKVSSDTKAAPETIANNFTKLAGGLAKTALAVSSADALTTGSKKKSS